MPQTLVVSTDMHIADSRMRYALEAFRTSFGDLGNFNTMSLQLARGESHQFETTRFIIAYLRDETDVTFTKDTTSFTLPSMQGTLQIPGSVEVTFSVPADSPISLERVIKVVYS